MVNSWSGTYAYLYAFLPKQYTSKPYPTTNAFLAVSEWFIARRGCPLTIFSDNGTNFVGATHKIERDFRIVFKQSRLRVESEQSCQNLS